MKRPLMSFLSTTLLVSAFLLFSACSKKDKNPPANMTNFAATLTGAQETPANAVAATGTFTATYDANTNKLSYTLTWTGLTDVPAAMHFHKAAVGVPGDVVMAITGFTAATAGTLTTTATVNDSDESDLMEGKFYVNIHTPGYPAGEIRGQVLKQ